MYITMTSITRQSLRSSGLQPAIVLKNICVDRSGSMHSFRGNQYNMTEELLLDTWKQARESNISNRVTLKTFDNNVNIMLCEVNPMEQDTPSLQIIRENLSPRGMTRLNDTVIESLNELKLAKENYLNTLSNEARSLNPKIVQILVVITDGQDNESSSNISEVREKILEFREGGGEAILMAANMDAQEIGSRYGFNDEQCLTVHNSDTNAIQSGFRSLTSVIRDTSLGTPAVGFTQTQRTLSQNMTGPLVPMPSLTTPPALTRQVARPVSPSSILQPLRPTYQTAYADLIYSQQY